MNRSLRTQMLVLLSGSFTLLLLLALGSFYLLSNSLGDYRALLAGPLRASQLIEEANLEFKIQVQEWKNELLRGKQPADREKYWKQFEKQESAVQDILSQLVALPGISDALKGQVERLRVEHRTLGVSYRKGREAFLAADADPVAGDRAVTGIDRAASEQMSALVEQLRSSSKAESAAISAAGSRTILVAALMLVVTGGLIALASLWLVNRRLITPIRALIEHIDLLSKGNFGERVASDRQDELGRLANAANTLRDFLAETFSRLRQSTAELDDASGELHAIARLMAQGSAEQFDRTDQVATAMNEMSATAQEVARHAAEAATAANDADHSARSGGAVMQATVSTITHMRDEIAATAGVIRRLESDSTRIGTVLEVIRGIADQTNLLALNAAIEAARAGEAGRGFAVVADEVRTLAQRTAASTAEIDQIISTVQSGAANAARAIENGQTRSDEGVEQVNQAGLVLTRITRAVEAIREMNQQIATAAEEQTSVAEDISRNLTEITAIAETNQGNVQRTEAASTNLHGLSAGLNQVIARLG